MKTGYTAAAGFNIVTSAKRGNHRVIAVTMGHNQQDQRDKKVSLMMEKALNKLATSDKIDVKQLYAELKPANKDKNKKTTQQASYLPKVSSAKGNWAIQIGAFGSYDKAQAHAQSVKNKLAGKFAFKGIKVEKSVSGGKTIYRSQLTGVAKDYATRACSTLKEHKYSCMVTSYKSNVAYAQN